ncbi:hypothetical protein BTJ40_10850 [Microbulbifer sp. A4B17]|uniref:hypothetical protein n=1 Tax=Microbulbifer sp. A4B17 TaxID=359370 RepID=UPI000D52E891|nr:hypothetical protein [Microbulbifer sp. A4B17]AWF81276.1 hypothetical protein BTJ40_10850 [Microbulbifer sp. A4B17]
MKKAKPFRKLGAQEALFVELTERSNGAVQLAVFFRACKSLGVEELMKGMEYLHNLHPMLRSRVEKNHDAYWFCDVGFEAIPIEIKHGALPLNYQEEFRRLGSKILELDKYVYRFTVYVNEHGNVKWIAFMVCHAAMDGRSLLLLVRDLDQYLRGDSRNKPTASAMQKSVVDYVSSIKYFKKTQPAISGGDYSPPMWSVEQAVKASLRKGCSIYRVLPKKLCAHLYLISKRENVQITSIYNAAAIIAAQSLPGFRSATELMLPINAQYLCKRQIDRDVIGECTTTLTIPLTSNETSLDLLSLAHLIQKKVYLQLRSGRFFEPPLEPDYSLVEIENMAEDFDTAKDYFPSGICVSNVGDIKEYTGPLTFFDFGVVMTVQTHGAHPIMLVTCTINGEGVFVFGYCEPLVSKESALKYIEKYMKVLRGFSEDNDLYMDH